MVENYKVQLFQLADYRSFLAYSDILLLLTKLALKIELAHWTTCIVDVPKTIEWMTNNARSLLRHSWVYIVCSVSPNY